jgi:hypothetical protein
MEDEIVHLDIKRPIIQNLHPEFLSHLRKQHNNLVIRFPIDLGYFDDMRSIIIITQTQISNLFIYSFSSQGYLKLYPIIRIKSKPFHKCCIFFIVSKDQYVLTMICHGQSQVNFFTNEMERTLNIGLKTTWGESLITCVFAIFHIVYFLHQ